MAAAPSPPPPSLAPEAPRFAWRARALLLFALGGLALVLGLAFRSSTALVLASPLLLAPLSTWVLAPRAPAAVEVRSDVLEVEADLDLTLELEAVPAWSPGEYEVTLRVPEGTEIPAGASQRVRVVSKGPVRVTFRVHPIRPVTVQLATPEVRWRDALGLGELALPVRRTPLLLEHYPPEVQRVPRLATRRVTPLPGEVRSRNRAPQGEFHTVRRYVPGDPPRGINWWASARRGALASNEYLAERSGELIVVLDTRPSHLPEDDDRQLLGVARAAALGLVRHLLRDKTRVGLVVFGELADCLPLRSGTLQRYLAETRIARAEIATVPGPMERLAISLQREYPRGTQVLLLSSLVADDTVYAGYLLRRAGFPCLILSPSPTTLESARMDLSREDGRMALRLFRLARERQLADAWQSAPVIEWEDFSSLAGLVAFLRKPPVNLARGRSA